MAQKKMLCNGNNSSSGMVVEGGRFIEARVVVVEFGGRNCGVDVAAPTMPIWRSVFIPPQKDMEKY